MANRDAKLIERTLKDFSLGAMSGNGGQCGGGGTTVVANPTLAGTEAELTGLQVGDTKYVVPQGRGSMEIVTLNFVPDGQHYNITQEQATKLQNGAILTDEMGRVFSLGAILPDNDGTLLYRCFITNNLQIEEINLFAIYTNMLLYQCSTLGKPQ